MVTQSDSLSLTVTLMVTQSDALSLRLVPWGWPRQIYSHSDCYLDGDPVRSTLAHCYLDGDPVGSTLTQAVCPQGPVLCEAMSPQRNGSFRWQLVGIKENSCLWVQGVLYIHHTETQTPWHHIHTISQLSAPATVQIRWQCCLFLPKAKSKTTKVTGRLASWQSLYVLISKIYIHWVNLHFDKQAHSPTHQQYTNRKAYCKICIQIPWLNFSYHRCQSAKACFLKLEGSLETGKTRLHPLCGKMPHCVPKYCKSQCFCQ